MPINVAQLHQRKSDPIRATIQGEDEPLIFRYFPQKLTSTLQSKLSNAGGDTAVLADVLAEVLLEWDLQENGQPWPLTRENLGLLGIPTLKGISDAIGAHQRGEEDQKNSNGSSAPAAVAAAVPIGSP